MKSALTYLLLAAASCGDNIKPASIDAAFDFSDVDPIEPAGVKPDDKCEVGVGECAATGKLVDGVCDAAAKPPEPETMNERDDDCDGAIDEGLACEDSHIDLNGHEHKCQHDQDLPSKP
jgi:hypothetical protein